MRHVLFVLLSAFVLSLPSTAFTQDLINRIADDSESGGRFSGGLLDQQADESSLHPLWQFRFALVGMRREVLRATPLIRQGSRVLIDASDFIFDYEAGLDTGISIPLKGEWGLEVRYIGVRSSDAHAETVVGETATLATTPPTFLTDMGAFAFNTESRLHSGEINFVRNLPVGMRLFAGFRAIEFTEVMEGEFELAQDPNPFDRYSVDVNNKLYGVQAGIESVAWARRGVHLDGFAKVGVLTNMAEQESGFVGTSLSTVAARAALTSVLFEGGLFTAYKLGKNCTLRAGYQVLWIGNLAIAAEQPSATGVFDQVGRIPPATVGRGDVLYHGGLIGMELAY